jgi:transposase
MTQIIWFGYYQKKRLYRQDLRESPPRDYDRELYKERNLIERMFNKLKHFRRAATRYDKLDIAYLSFVLIASIMTKISGDTT